MSEETASSAWQPRTETGDPQLLEKIRKQATKIERLQQEIQKVVVGQQHMVSRLLMGLFTNGHILLEGVPGLAKTLTISTLAKALHLDFNRVQFTPDLLPADLIGTLIYNQHKANFEVKKGPIFANIILADEINRSPAKVQSALLEAMQEKQVSIGGTTYPLDKPFLVMATQNPVEQEGTYPLPEAQVDRFMMKVFVGYPTRNDEKEIMRRMAKTSVKDPVQPIMTKEDIFEIRSLVDSIRVSDRIEDYIIDLVMCTRKPQEYNLAKLNEYIEFGASPRASIALNLASRAHALTQGRDFVLPEDVKAIAVDVLNHRIILNYEAEADEITTEMCVKKILETVKIP